MKRKTYTAKIGCLIMSFAMLFPFFGISTVAVDYYDEVNELYYFGNYQLYPNDYAEAYVTEYGDWIEGEPIPTDFEARTYGQGVLQMPGWYKIMHVYVKFYDPELFYVGQDCDMVEIPYSASSSYPTEGTAVAYGDGHVNEEYGLCTFTSWHNLSIHFYDGIYEEYFPIADTIIIDTTGFYS